MLLDILILIPVLMGVVVIPVIDTIYQRREREDRRARKRAQFLEARHLQASTNADERREGDMLMKVAQQK